jgi:IMP dehydrogenase/GMP reductase
MAIAMAQQGGIGIIHKNMAIEITPTRLTGKRSESG